MQVRSLNRPLWQYGALAAGLAGYWFVLPHKYWLPCPIKAVTGLYCPGCGSTRAVFALLHGNVPLAAHDNALLLASPVLIVLGMLISGKAKRQHLYLYLGLLLALVVAFVVLRNQGGSFLSPLYP